MTAEMPTNPLSRRERIIVTANAELRGEPCPGCGRTVDVCDCSQDGALFVVHESDGVGLSQRTPYGERSGCRLDPDEVL